MSVTNSELMVRGMRCLSKEMGIVEAEQFISLVIREKSDYEKWRKEYFNGTTLEEFNRDAAEYDKAHPFTGNAVRL